MKFTPMEKEKIAEELKKMTEAHFHRSATYFQELFSTDKELVIEFNFLWLEESKRRMELLGLK